MPPKRNSASSSGTAPKRAKTAYVITSRSRWSKVSGSGNAEAWYKEQTKKLDAYSYICLCKAPVHHRLADDEEDKDEDDEDEDEDDDGDSNCDGGETCLCKKPLAEHPGHVWTMSSAGHAKLLTTLVGISLRNPDAINLYTYKYHSGYGVMEAIENLLLDFDEAKYRDNLEEQWVICEVAAMLFLRDELIPLFMVDDSEMVGHLCDLVGTMFLTMLAKLEHRSLLKPDSEMKNLALIMALFIRIAPQPYPCDAFDELDTRVLAYANKHQIAVGDVPGMRASVDAIQEEAEKVKLPDFKAGRYDPWKWRRSFREYEDEVEDLPFYAIKPNTMGGDGLDFTTWPSDRRKEHSFEEKDPLSEEVIDSLKKGMMVQLADA